MKGNVLERILTHKKIEIENAHRHLPLSQLISKLSQLPPTKDFKAALQKDTVALIGEIKFKSPSRGVIQPVGSLAKTVAAYREAACEAISVLTDFAFFGGSGGHLREAGRLTEQPLLRKDFIIDPYQLYEARVLGADAVLLLAGILTLNSLKEYIQLAEELGMAALVECRSLGEIEKAIKAGASVIGINNRDLNTFKVDLETTLRLVPEIKDESVVVVSESGIQQRLQVEMLAACGVDAILVGEALMSAPDLKQQAKSLRGVAVRRRSRC